MDKSTSSPKNASSKRQDSRLFKEMTKYITEAISKADEAAAADRVAGLQETKPDATEDELAEILIKQKSFQTGAVGAITSGMALIPGLGTLTTLTFGVAVDSSMTLKMQAELVLELAALYDRTLNADAKQQVVALVTGISFGANQVLTKTGRKIAEEVTQQLAQKSMVKSIPVIGVGASAGVNAFTTYIIGRRAQAYFKLGPEAVGDWSESMRAISGIDKRKIIAWLTETTERSWQLIGESVQTAAGGIIVAGQSTGEVIAIQSGRASETAGGIGQQAVQGISSATGTMVEVSRRMGTNVTLGANVALEATQDTARWAAVGITAGANKAGAATTRAGRSVAIRAGAAVDAVSRTGKRAGKGITSGVSQMGQKLRGLFKRGKKDSAVEEDTGTTSDR